MKKAFKAFRGLARRYWDDGRHSGVDTATRRLCYHSAAVRCGLDDDLFARYWRSCVEPQAHGRMFAFNEHLTGCLDARGSQ